MNDELKPCPFCGSHAEFGVVSDPDSQDHGGHFVQCTNPRCHGCMGLRFACGDDPRPLLAEAWNQRATHPTDAKIKALVEAVRGLVIAVRYNDPPKAFNGVLCHEARIPVEFIADVENALAAFEGDV